LFKQNQYDVVFMDVNMPEMDGIETTKLIRGINPDQHIIALSADETSLSETEWQQYMNDYVVKPLNIDKIKNVLLGE
ncbi:MAG: response regulator, partial [Alphaproteobacteria bacterium]|nr:response regulator [Alphaproteobacteria bacterium]